MWASGCHVPRYRRLDRAGNLLLPCEPISSEVLVNKNREAAADDGVSAGGQAPSTTAAASAPGRRRSGWLLALAIAVPLVLLVAVAVNGMERPEGTTGGGADVASERAVINPGAAGSEPPQVGDRAPAFEVPTLSGGTFQMPSGRPTILTFVNLCPTCIEATRRVGMVQERFDDVAVLAVASDPTADKAAIEDFIRRAGSPDFELALDPQGTLTERFDAFSMNANVLVVDDGGRITYRGPAAAEAITAALTAAGARR